MSTMIDFSQSIRVERWPTERPLFVLVLLSAIVLWILFVVSIIGIVYAAMLFLFFFVSHVAFITYLRGSAVRLGPEQMPDIYNRVQQLSNTIGLKKMPAAYVMQAGGALNALATKLFSTNFIVLYSDLLDACGDNTQARDMIIAHELGHLKAGHLRWIWFLLPGLLVPILGGAYCRAREYTADRYGFSVSANRDAALTGLAILAAGGTLAPKVNLRSLAGQGNDLNGIWMTLGRWLASHPPLADRLVAIEPSLAVQPISRLRGAIGAIALIVLTVALPAAAAMAFGTKALTAVMQSQLSTPIHTSETMEEIQMSEEQITEATSEAWNGIKALSETIEAYREKAGELPQNQQAAYAAWQILHPQSDPPMDPFDGYYFGYEITQDSYVIWSEGPSADTNADDLVFRPQAAQP